MNNFQKMLVLTLIIFSSPITLPIRVKAAPTGTVSITFRQSGIGNETTRTVLRIDAVRYLASDLPVTFEWAPGSNHSVYYANQITAEYGKRYIFLGWENAQGMVGGQQLQELVGGQYEVPASDEAITIDYRAQYFLTLKARSLKPALPINSTINVFLNGEQRGNITELKPITYWENDTSLITIAVDPTIPAINGISYTFIGWDDGETNNSRPIYIKDVVTYQAIFQAQYQVSFSSPDQGSITPTETSYYPSGSTIPVLAIPNLGYAFSKWSSEGQISFENPKRSSTMAKINGPGSITVEFTDSVFVTFAANKTQSDAQGPLLTIDGVSYTYSQLPQVFKWTPDSIHDVSAQPLSPANISKRYQFIGWSASGRPNGGKYTVPNLNSTVTTRYRNQYYLEVNNGGHGSISGGGWYNEGENATVAITPTTVSGGTANEWAFTGWSSLGRDGYSGSNSSFTINVQGGLLVTAQWVERPVQIPQIWKDLMWAVNIIIIIFGTLLVIRWFRSK